MGRYKFKSYSGTNLIFQIMERFLKKINKTDNCWLWTAAIRGKTGY